jgi:hypothetical protein
MNIKNILTFCPKQLFVYYNTATSFIITTQLQVSLLQHSYKFITTQLQVYYNTATSLLQHSYKFITIQLQV